MYVFLDISILNKKPNNSETLECVKETYYAQGNKGPLIYWQGHMFFEVECNHTNQTNLTFLQSTKLRDHENGFHDIILSRILSKDMVGVEIKVIDCVS